MVGPPGLTLNLRWNHCFVFHLILAIRVNLALFPQCIRGARSCVESRLGGFLSVGRDRLAKRRTGGWIDRKRALGVWALARVVPILLVVAMGSVTLSAIWIQPASASLSSWTATTNYPVSVSGEICVMSSGFVYCVGGNNGTTRITAVYFAPLSSSGVGSWIATTSYPTNVISQSCVASSGFIYCVGGFDGVTSVNSVYFAPLSSSGVGSWSTTTNYPIGITGQSCVAISGFVYCIAGRDSANLLTSAVYFAPLSSSGVGSWSPTASYPIVVAFHSCVASSGLVYCVGGLGSASQPNDVYFAPLSSSGVGSWSATTNYPMTIVSESCVASSGFVHCIGGQLFNGAKSSAVDFAPLNSSGVGSWLATTNYPTTIADPSCVARAGVVYCVAGLGGPTNTQTNAVYFAFVTQVTQDVTSTFVTCSPSFIAASQPTQCTATVTDTSATPISPGGTVTFSGNSSGSFDPSNTCELSSTGSSTASCASTVSYIPSAGAEGSHTITGTYSGEPAHLGSSGTTSLTVGKRTSSTTVNCSKVKGNIVCTVTVTDTAPGTPVTPTGTVSMGSTGTGTFTNCALSGTGSSAACTVTYTPGKGKTGIITITGTFGGDRDHLGSSGSTTVRSS